MMINEGSEMSEKHTSNVEARRSAKIEQTDLLFGLLIDEHRKSQSVTLRTERRMDRQHRLTDAGTGLDGPQSGLVGS
jgi:hypothetical protein